MATLTRKTNLYRKDLTTGPILKQMLAFILPLIATNLLQATYNAADMMVVGLSHEPDAVGAVGITNTFITLINNIFIGFAMGGNVIVARYLGAKDDKNASIATHTAILISVLFGVSCGLLGILISRPILTLMGAEGKFLELGVTYTYIYLAGTPFIALMNYLISIFRAKGDTKTPLIVLSLSGLVNVGLNLFFVLVLNLSVEGVAGATVTANALSAIVLLSVLSKDDSPCRFRFKKLTLNKSCFLTIIKIGIPAALQGALFSISNLIIQSSVLRVNGILAPNAEFQPVVKGHAASGNIEAFAYTTQNAVYQATITFVSQNMGAKKPDRLNKVVYRAYMLAIIIIATTSTIITLVYTPFLSLYGVVPGTEGSLERIAYETSYMRLNYMLIPYFTIGIMEVGSAVLRGMGKSTSSMIICLIGACLLRIVWVMTIFNASPTMPTLYLSYPISWVLTGSILFIVGLICRKKFAKQVREENEILCEN